MKLLALLVGVVFGLFLASLIGGSILWVLWPYSGEVLGLPALTLWQSMVTFLVVRLLFINYGKAAQ